MVVHLEETFADANDESHHRKPNEEVPAEGATSYSSDSTVAEGATSYSWFRREVEEAKDIARQ